MDKREKFAKLVAKWLIEGKMYFIEDNAVVKDNKSIMPCIEFAGGGEPVGNGGYAFSWLELMSMAESQGLL